MPQHVPDPVVRLDRTAGPRRQLVGRLAVAIAAASLLLSSQGVLAAPGGATMGSRSFGDGGQHGKRAITRTHLGSARSTGAGAALHPRPAAQPLPRRLVPIAHAASPGPAVNGARSINPVPRIIIPNVAAADRFAGLSEADAGPLEPPDPWVAVNSTYVVQVVNTIVRVSNRAGAELLSVPEWALFALRSDQQPSDARIIWDAVHGRWVGNVLSYKGDFSVNYLNVAVSDTADPTGGWTLFPIQFTGYLPDFPALASSSDKIVVTDNLFTSAGTFNSADINTITWASILAGGNVAYNFCGDAAYAHPRVAQVLSGSNDVHLVMEDTSTATGHSPGDQWYYRLTGAGSCGQIVDGLDMTAAFLWGPFTVPPDPRQSGSPATITNAGDERPTDAVWQNGKLWWVSTFPVSYDLDTTFNDEVVLWGANTVASGTPTANTAVEISPADGTDAFMGGLGMSRSGTLFVTYSQSSASTPVSLWANRVVGGVLGAPLQLDISAGPYNGTRWGDYAGVAMDPVGTGAVWAIHEVAAGDGSWRTDVVRLLVDGDLPTTPGVPSATTVSPTALGFIPKYRVAWTGASDVGSGAVRYRLEVNVDGLGFGAASTVNTLSTVRSLSFGHSYQFRVAAFDALGHVGSWATGPVLNAYLYQQTSGTTFAGSWLTQTSTAYSGGSARYASAAGASGTFTTTFARSIAFVTTKAASRGSFRVYVDGVLKATLSAYSTTTQYRQVVYQYTWPTRGTHSIKIYVLGTAGHPRVDVDAFLALK